MNITPEQAGDLLPGTTPGPWTMHRHVPEDFIRVTGEDLKDIADNGVVEDADARLIAAAPDLAQAIAGMTEEWGVDANGDALFPVREEGHPMGSYFTPDRAEAEGVRDRMAKLNPHNNYLLIRRLISVPEVIDGE